MPTISITFKIRIGLFLITFLAINSLSIAQNKKKFSSPNGQILAKVFTDEDYSTNKLGLPGKAFLMDSPFGMKINMSYFFRGR